MKLVFAFVFVFASLVIPCGLESAQHPKVTGVFSDMHWVAEAGDVLGIEVFITYSSDGLSGQHWALVQEAEGVTGTPVLVKATVSGDRVEFTVPDEMGGRFIGRVTASSLSGQFEKFTEKTVLPRRRSYWQ